MPDIALDTATLMALFLEALFYGIFLALYVVTIVQQWKAREAHRSMWYIPISGMMLTFATTHLIIAFVRVNYGFTIVTHTTEGVQEYFSDASVPLQVALNCIYVLQTTIGDAVLIWRLYVVYAHNVWVASPFVVTLFANLVTGIIACYLEGKAPSGSTIFSPAYKWIETFFILTMCTNILCTAGIMWRIWSRGHHQGGLKWALLLVAESGILYTAAVLALFVAYVKKSQGQYVAIGLVVPLVGIIFVLITLRSYFRNQLGGPPSQNCPRPLGLSHLPLSRSHGILPFGMRHEGKGDHAMRAISVHVTRDTESTNCPDVTSTDMSTSGVQDDPMDDSKTPRDAALY